MTNNVVPFPMTNEERRLNEYGEGVVECAFTEKWLQFPETVVDKRHIPVKLMANINDEVRQLTQVILNQDDLLRAVDAIKLEKD